MGFSQFSMTRSRERFSDLEGRWRAGRDAAYPGGGFQTLVGVKARPWTCLSPAVGGRGGSRLFPRKQVEMRSVPVGSTLAPTTTRIREL